MDASPGDPGARRAGVRAAFDRIAPAYDDGAACFDRLGRRLVARAGVAAGARVLDVATGHGASLLPAARRAGPAGRVVGLDLAPGMLRRAGERAQAAGVDVELVEGDGERLPFADGAFDRVLCGFGLMFMPDPVQALAEARRVLAADGLVAVSTWRTTQVDDLLRVLAELGVAGPGDGVHRLDAPDAVRDALAGAGLEDIDVAEERATFRYPDLDAYLTTARGTGARAALERLGPDDEGAVRAALARRLADRRDADGYACEAVALVGIARRASAS